MKVLNQGLTGRGIRQLDKNGPSGTWVEGTDDEKLRRQGVWPGKITEAYVMFCEWFPGGLGYVHLAIPLLHAGLGAVVGSS